MSIGYDGKPQEFENSFYARVEIPETFVIKGDIKGAIEGKTLSNMKLKMDAYASAAIDENDRMSLSIKTILHMKKFYVRIDGLKIAMSELSRYDLANLDREIQKYVGKWYSIDLTDLDDSAFALHDIDSTLKMYGEIFEEMNMTNENSDIPQKPVDKTSVLVVATQNDAIAKYRSIVSQCSLSASFFEIEIFSSIRANFEHELSPVLLMDFGASRTKLSIVEFGTIKNYHTIDRGGADITDSIAKSLSIPFSEAEKLKKEFGLFGNPVEKTLPDIIKIHIDYIFAETNNVLLGYEKKYNKIISKVIFTGGGSLLKGLSEVAANNFRAEIETGHPFSKVNAPEFLNKVLETMGPEFAVALGLALRKLQ